MDTNPQYRAKTDPKADSNVTYETEIRNRGSGSSTGWIIGGLVVLALIAAFFMWGGTGTPPAPTTGTTTEQPATPPATPEQPATPTQPQGGTTTQPEGSTQQPAAPAPEQPATPTAPAPEGGTTGGTTGQGTTNP